MNKPHIKETISKALCYLTESDMTELQNLARSYLKALESGIPTEYEHKMGCKIRTDIKLCDCGVSIKNETLYDMLPHIVARDERIMELEEKLKKLGVA